MIRMRVGRGGGTQVIHDIVPADLIGRAMEMSRQRLENLCEVRRIIELAAAELAAARATPAQICELDRIIGQKEALVSRSQVDWQGYTRLHIAFHQQVMRCAGNDLLTRTYTPFLREFLWAMDMADVVEMGPHHLRTLRDFSEAVKRRDPLAAKAAIYSHISPVDTLLQTYFAAEETAQDTQLASSAHSPKQACLTADGSTAETAGNFPHTREVSTH